MVLGIILVSILAFLFGWFLKDYKWTKAAKTGKVMVVDGDMYKVKTYAEKMEGSEE